jgi:hypothetical protein
MLPSPGDATVADAESEGLQLVRRERARPPTHPTSYLPTVGLSATDPTLAVDQVDGVVANGLARAGN